METNNGTGGKPDGTREVTIYIPTSSNTGSGVWISYKFLDKIIDNLITKSLLR